MKIFTIILIALYFLSSCASTSSSGERPVVYDYKVIKFPPLDTAVSEELGNTLVEYSTVLSTPSYRLIRDYQSPKNRVGEYFIYKAQVFVPKTIDLKGKKKFSSKHTYFGYQAPPEGKFRDNYPYATLSLYQQGEYAGKGLCAIWMRSEYCISPEYLEETSYVDFSQPNIKQQLIYNGKIGNYVKFLYREISQGEYLRPAFSQEIQYDLEEGKEIGFKGARIEVLEATNRTITYKVKSHFNN